LTTTNVVVVVVLLLLRAGSAISGAAPYAINRVTRQGGL
jgi:hypothetical protein